MTGVLDHLHVAEREDGVLQPKPLALLGVRLKEVAFRPDRTLQGHDNLLSEWIDRRVGHLSKELLEVLVDERLHL